MRSRCQICLLVCLGDLQVTPTCSQSWEPLLARAGFSCSASWIEDGSNIKDCPVLEEHGLCLSFVLYLLQQLAQVHGLNSTQTCWTGCNFEKFPGHHFLPQLFHSLCICADSQVTISSPSCFTHYVYVLPKRAHVSLTMWDDVKSRGI